MGNWNELIAAIETVIKENGNQEITGTVLQNVLTNLVANVGDNATFVGEARPNTNPGSPDGNVFYIATQSGIYVNFNGYEVKDRMTVLTNKTGQWVGRSLGVKNDKFVMNFINSITFTNLLSNNLTEAFYTDRRLSANGGTLVSNSTYPYIATNKGVPITEGQVYCVSGSYWKGYTADPIRGTINTEPDMSGIAYAPIWTKVTDGYQFTAPIDGYIFVDFELSRPSLDSLKYESQISATDSVKPYTEFGQYTINDSAISDIVESINKINAEIEDIVVVDSYNKINPAKILYDRRYSIFTKNIIAVDPAQYIGFGGLIPVEEGEWYTASGVGIYSGYQGGYFAAGSGTAIGTPAIDNITWVNPVSGAGKSFQVPTGRGIKYVVVSVALNSDKTGLAGDAQLESGQIATAYQPYSPIKKINPELLPEIPKPEPTRNTELLKYTTFGNLNYNGLADKIPNFRKHWYAKDKNICVLTTGTSLSAGTTKHCTVNANAKTRPPLMQANNLASHIWDALKWEGQHYRRYDSGYFTEVGAWASADNLSEWDDGQWRSGLTRYSDTVGSTVSFVVPVDAWQYNFIFRTDSAGSENCVITIAEGVGKMEVLNDSGEWVEANGYTFSQREPDIVRLPVVNYTSPINDRPATTLRDYQIKGNTTYQKRLYMRCKSGVIDSRTETKSITISRSSGRLMYWGVEWSAREFMITYINAARGSHNSLINQSTSSLTHYQDNEVWNFKPDLLLTEDPIHNSGGAGIPNKLWPTEYYGRVTENFFMADNGVSMKARCQTLGLEVPEMVLYNTSISWNFGAIDADGNLKLAPTLDGYMWTALDAQSDCYMHMIEKYPDIVYINAVKHFVKACYDCYGNMKAATEASGKDGETFTDEGSHWNDTGCRVMARVILPILDMVV